MLDADGNDNGIKGVVDASMPDCIREGFVIKTTGARRLEVELKPWRKSGADGCSSTSA